MSSVRPTVPLAFDSNVASIKVSLTAEELIASKQDGVRYELIEGVVQVMSPAGYEHGRIAMLLGCSISQYVKDNDLGIVFAAETGFLLSRNPDTVRAPDVAFVRKEQLSTASACMTYWPTAPDLAVEVVSPNDSYSYVVAKAATWLKHGSEQVWIVDPEQRQVAIHRSEGLIEVLLGDQILVSPELFPRWQLPLAELFKPIF